VSGHGDQFIKLPKYYNGSWKATYVVPIIPGWPKCVVLMRSSRAGLFEGHVRFASARRLVENLVMEDDDDAFLYGSEEPVIMQQPC
jgi:hypothetical protein